MTAEGLRISRVLERAREAAVAPRRESVVGDTARGSAAPVAAFQVRHESRDGKGRRIVERWTETITRGGRA